MNDKNIFTRYMEKMILFINSIEPNNIEKGLKY